MTGGATVQETGEKKAVATEIFENAAFNIHEWHSNESGLEGAEGSPLDVNGEETYAKQQLGEELKITKANYLDSPGTEKGTHSALK